MKHTCCFAIIAVVMKKVSQCLYQPRFLEGTKTIQQVGHEIFELVMDIARGKEAKGEYFNIQEFAIPNVSVVKKEVLHAQMAANQDFRFMQT